MSAFFYQIPILWHISSYGKCMCFQINLPQHRRMQRNPLIWESLGNWYSYFPKVFSQNQNPMVYFITWEIDGFCTQFPITQEYAAKTTLRYRYPYFFQKKATFLPSNSSLMVFYITSEMHGFSHPFFIAWENSSKILSYECTHNSFKLQVLLFLQISNIWMVHGFSNKFPVLWVSSVRPTYHMRETWNINTYTFLKILVIFLPPNTLPMGY